VGKNTGFGKVDIGKMSVFNQVNLQSYAQQRENVFIYQNNPKASEITGALYNSKVDMINFIKLQEISTNVT